MPCQISGLACIKLTKVQWHSELLPWKQVMSCILLCCILSNLEHFLVDFYNVSLNCVLSWFFCIFFCIWLCFLYLQHFLWIILSAFVLSIFIDFLKMQCTEFKGAIQIPMLYLQLVPLWSNVIYLLQNCIVFEMKIVF